MDITPAMQRQAAAIISGCADDPEGAVVLVLASQAVMAALAELDLMQTNRDGRLRGLLLEAAWALERSAEHAAEN
jgi:hypothetical protein